MQVVHDFSGETPEGVVQYIQKSFDTISYENGTAVLMNGLNCMTNEDLKNKYANYNRRGLLALWTPCEFAQPYPTLLDLFGYFTEVYCVCKYTCEWMKTTLPTTKFIHTCYPFTNYSSQPSEKTYDISYFGGIHSPEQDKGIGLLKHFDYRFLSLGSYGSHANMVTGRVSPDQKLKMVSQGKISLCYNWISVFPRHHKCIQTHTKQLEHGAFERQNRHIAPQFKVRINEVASSGSLVLCRKDQWNVIEDWYVPDEDFVYFEDEDELYHKIKEILNNWDHFQNIAKNGYHKSLQYTVENFFNSIKE